MIGTTLSHYKIIEKLGQGGQGEVYLAEDSRLDRKVALKILPQHLSDRAELRERFEREARAVSSLNHPHICTLYDIGEQDGIHYLVMEHLVGETLEARLAKGPLPLEQTLEYAIQIADALDKAHRQGVVHRDLKPGNIMLVKSGAKLLDFGLAKLQAAEKPTNLSALPTEQANLTAEGTILGTLQYMAPEQLEGKEADNRTDIFAFGAVVYEMATGKKAFEGKSQASLIAAIMGQDPRPMAELQPMTPQLLDWVVKRCLEKEPDERVQSAHDVMAELKWVREGAVSDTSVHEPPRKGLAWSLVVVLGLFLVGVLAAWYSDNPTVEGDEVVRFSVGPSEGFTLAVGQNGPSPAMSPDGQWLAFRAVSEGVVVLTVRSLDSLATRTLPGTEGAASWFWSPDSQSVGFVAEGKLKTTDVAGGLPRTVASIETFLLGGTWNRDGVILLGTNNGIYQVPATGGDLTPVTQVDRSQSELRHTQPSFLPDGIHFLYLVLSTPQEDSGVFIGSMDSEERKFLMNSSSGAQYASGHLLFIREGSLMAQEFDATRMELSGTPNRVAEGVRFNAFSGAGAFAVSENEVLTYFGGGVTEWGIRGAAQLAWVDREGHRLESIGDIAGYAQIALSPDERRLVAEVMTEEGTFDLWLLDLERQGISSRITFTSTNERDPVWSPDGHDIAFSWNPNGLADLYRMTLGQDTEPALLAESEDLRLIPEDWSRDGHYISYNVDGSPAEIRVFPLAEGEESFAVVQGAFSMDEPHFSPDGGWIAYESNESGATEVYVQPFQKQGEKIRISTGGGSQARWRGDGKELFYLAADRRMMGVQMSLGTTMQAGIPKALFQTSVNYAQGLDQYAVASDGQRFLIITPMASPESGEITVVLNWTAELDQ